MKPVLEVVGLQCGFGSRTVLREISFTIGEGQSAGLAGANGAGKSTLIWAILGLLPSQGQVRIFGRPRGGDNQARLGVVFQNPEDHLFMPSLEQDLTLPLLNRGEPFGPAREKALEALESVGLAEYAAAPAMQLSLGQRKRAAIASALVDSPDLLILDEPTAELDPRAVRQLTALLNRLPVAKLIASHHLEFLETTTARTLLLHAGVLAADGPSESVLQNQGLLTEVGLI
jgi:cobalt/nickel transport system ATP-binding protein